MGVTEGFFAALEWAAAWKVGVSRFIDQARGYAGSEKGVSNVGRRMERNSRWRKPFQQELPVQTRQMVGESLFLWISSTLRHRSLCLGP